MIGQYAYCGGASHGNTGLYTDKGHSGSQNAAVAIVTHVPSGTEPWLGVASLL